MDIPLLFYMIVACISLAYAGYRLFPGLKAFKRSRMALFSRHAAYVVAFVTIWIWPLLNALLPHRTTSDFFYVTDATLITGQAVVFASIRLLEPGAQRALRRSCRRKPTKPGVRRENSVRAPLLLYGPIVPRMPRDEPGDGGGNGGHHSYGTPQNAFDRAREKQRRKQRQRQGRHDGSGKHTPMSRSPNMAIGRQHRQQHRQSQRQRQHSVGTEPSDNSHSASTWLVWLASLRCGVRGTPAADVRVRLQARRRCRTTQPSFGAIDSVVTCLTLPLTCVSSLHCA